MKLFSALKVLTQSGGLPNGSATGRRAVWRWAAVPVGCDRPFGSAALPASRQFHALFKDFTRALFAVPDTIPSTDKTEWEISDSSSDLCNIFVE